MSDQSIRELLRTKYRVEDGKKFLITDYNADDTAGLSLSPKEAKKVLKKRIKRLSYLQELLFANGHSALLVALQGMDTSGKDGTIKHVTSGINPQGITITSFKQPGPVELMHDYLWRIHMAVPSRGKITIFNRSHYEEVLVTKVHPSILANQKLPLRVLNNKNFWSDRYEDIRNFEKYIYRQGIGIVKCFLNISKEEQRKRLLARLENKEKQWKFSPNDPKERQFWEEYQGAYQEVIVQTAAPNAPWFVIPANNKWFARLVVAEIMIDELEKLHIPEPKPSQEVLESLNSLKAELGGKFSNNKVGKKIKKNNKIGKDKKIKNLNKSKE